MNTPLHSLDLVVLAAYIVGMLAMGAWLSRRREDGEDYFLAGRSMPWFAVGVSVIASLLSSLTYMSEPGEVWSSGVTHMLGKLLAIPFEMAFVWAICIPFLMRFRYTSAYEFLGDRFGDRARALGVAMFLLLVVLWMGFVVLASARALATVTGFSLIGLLICVGLVATIYTTLGGLRAVVWTDVVQVALLVGGGVFAIGYVGLVTGSGLGDWYRSTEQVLARQGAHAMPWFSLDPHVRATVVTVAINMCVWHVCTHVGNQMTVQRYFCTSDLRAARRSFVTGSLLGVVLNVMLLVVGLAVLHFYASAPVERATSVGVERDADGRVVALEGGLDPRQRQQRDLIFPTFAVHRLPPGVAGAVIAALLAAAMSSIDSGVNSMATVVAVERRRRRGADSHEVERARWLTFAFGAAITFAAWMLDGLPSQWNIVDAMPRTFNAVTAPLGALFLIGMLLPRAGQGAAIAGGVAGLLISVGLGYFEQLGKWLHGLGWLAAPPQGLSFTWVMPGALLASLLVAAAASWIWPSEPRQRTLTWWSK